MEGTPAKVWAFSSHSARAARRRSASCARTSSLSRSRCRSNRLANSPTAPATPGHTTSAAQRSHAPLVDHPKQHCAAQRQRDPVRRPEHDRHRSRNRCGDYPGTGAGANVSVETKTISATSARPTPNRRSRASTEKRTSIPTPCEQDAGRTSAITAKSPRAASAARSGPIMRRLAASRQDPTTLRGIVGPRLSRIHQRATPMTTRHGASTLRICGGS
jgi:hypothetical protein